MNLALSMVVVVGFAATLEILDLPSHARDVGDRSLDCLSIMRNEDLSDLEKEQALQEETKQLFRLLGILGGGSILALGGPLAGVWLLDQIGLGDFPTVLAILQRLDFLAGTMVAGILAYVLITKLRPS